MENHLDHHLPLATQDADEDCNQLIQWQDVAQIKVSQAFHPSQTNAVSSINQLLVILL